MQPSRATAGAPATGRATAGVEARLDPERIGHRPQVGLDLGGAALGDLELEVHGVHRVGLADDPGLEVDDVDLVGGQGLGHAGDQAGPVTTSIIAKWPPRMVMEVSSPLQPASARTRVTAATIPGRSRPNTETAKRAMPRTLEGPRSTDNDPP
jgi:hypothetical protein